MAYFDWMRQAKGLTISLFAYLFISLGSGLYALNFSEFSMEATRSIFFVSTFILLIGLCVKRRSNLDFLMKAVVASTAIIGVLGLWDFIQQQGHLQTNKFQYSIQSWMAHKNLMASALFMGIPYCIYFILVKKKGWRFIALISLFLSTLLIIIVQSRAVWLAIFAMAVVGVLSIFWLVYQQKVSFSKRVIFASIVPVSILMVTGFSVLQVTYFSKLSHSNALKNRLVSIFEYKNVKNEHTETINERLALWDNTWQLIQDRPLLGVGGGNWKIFFPSKGLDGLRAEQGMVNFQRPHNDFLWIWSEKGIVGLLAWLGILGFVIWMGIQTIFRTIHPARLLQVLLSLLGLMGYAIIAFFDFPSERCLHLFYLAVFLTVPSVHYLAGKKWVISPKKVAARPVLLFLLLLNLGSFCILGFRSVGEKNLLIALKMRGNQVSPKMLDSLDQSQNIFYQLDPTAIPIDWYKGEVFYFQGRFESAKNHFEKALHLHPYQVNTLNNLGSTYHALQQEDKALECYQKALEIAPHFTEPCLNAAALYFNQGKQKEALAHFLPALPSPNNKRYTLFLKTLFSKEIEVLIQENPNPVVQDKLKELMNSPDWMLSIHQKYYDDPHQSIQEYLMENVLFVLKESENSP